MMAQFAINMQSQNAVAILLSFTVCFACSWSSCSYFGYKVISFNSTSEGLFGILELNQKTDVNGPDIEELQVSIRYDSPERLHIHITSTNISSARWEIPDYLIPRQVTSRGNARQESDLKFVYKDNPFSFSVIRNSTGDVLFDTSFGNLVFKEQYLEISSFLPNNAALYGLGESTRPQGFRLVEGQTYTLWASDIPSSTTDVDLYGAHPFYMDVREGGLSHGVLLLNSNGMDISYQANSLTYKVIGGIFDFYIFSGPYPLGVMEQYTGLIGRPAPMPFWSLGFQQCRYGYESVEDLENVVADYRAASIPLEVIWNDIDYMDAYKDFTFDPVNYPVDKMRDFVERLHANNQRYVLILDPGISTDENYTTFQHGKEKQIFIQRDGEPYLAQVWPGPVYFTDFLHPDIDSFWGTEITNFHELVPFDGLWIDMNEASNFCSGTLCEYPKNTSCTASLDQAYCCLVCNNDSLTVWDDPPYAINVAGIHRGLGMRTIAPSATHHNGFLQYNTHNMYGFSEAIATNRALRNLTRKRPFILSRSTFPGIGAYAAHWTGDNSATWEDLGYSIVGILNSGLFGVPMVGADICGFLGDTEEELCNRWIQLGAFYPFSRNHADIASERQELYLWESVTQSARKALGLRYKLLPYLYTLIQQAHETGAPVARPLFFSFPEDANTLNISSQYLLGEGVLVSPVLKKGVDYVDAYFPRGTWYNLFDYMHVVISKGSYERLSAPWDTINVHVREGMIIPMQKAALTTEAVRKTPFTLVVALTKTLLRARQIDDQHQSYYGRERNWDHDADADEEEEDINVIRRASGRLYVDDGEDLEMMVKEGKSTMVRFWAEASRDGKVKLTSEVECAGYALTRGQQEHTIEKVVVLGLTLMNARATATSATISSSSSSLVQRPPSFTTTVRIDGGAAAAAGSGSGSSSSSSSVYLPATVQYAHEQHVLTISGLNLPLAFDFTLVWDGWAHLNDAAYS